MRIAKGILKETSKGAREGIPVGISEKTHDQIPVCLNFSWKCQRHVESLEELVDFP